MSGLMGALEANMASAMPNYSHLSFKPLYILSTQVNQSDFRRGHGSNLISILKGPHLVFLCWYKGWIFSKYGNILTNSWGQWSTNMGPKANGSLEANPREFCPGNEA